MRRLAAWLAAIVAATGCAQVNTDLTKLPAVEPGQPAFYPTLQAYAGAPIVGGNDVQILLNGEEIFPAVVAAIRAARTSITYAQYRWRTRFDPQQPGSLLPGSRRPPSGPAPPSGPGAWWTPCAANANATRGGARRS